MHSFWLTFIKPFKIVIPRIFFSSPSFPNLVCCILYNVLNNYRFVVWLFFSRKLVSEILLVELTRIWGLLLPITSPHEFTFHWILKSILISLSIPAASAPAPLIKLGGKKQRITAVSLLCTLYTEHCALFTVHCNCTLYIDHCPLGTVQRKLYT